MTLSVEFLNRDFTERAVFPWQSIDVLRHSWSAQGGPKHAQLHATGNEIALYEFMEMLRCPVVVIDSERAEPVWWGHIENVTIYANDTKIAATLPDMANSIAVAHTTGIERFTTSYAANADSVTEYGQKDLLLSMRDVTDDQAQNYRDTELDRRKYPPVSVPLKSTGNRVYADIECRGWSETIDWRYYSQAAGQEVYEDLDSWYGREIGEDTRPMAAQSFQNTSGANWDADKVWLRVHKAGAPVDDFQVALYSDVGGDPGASLATASMAGADINEYAEWTEFELSSDVTLVAGTTYWIRVTRSGGMDVANFYVADGNSSEGYTNGELKLWDGSAWVTWGLPCDLNFRVTGTQETTAQISTIIDDAGEFVIATDIDDASGVHRNQYRNGDSTALFEIIELLNIGTSNNRRLLMRILSNYHLRVYEEPAQYEMDYSLDAGNIVRDQYGAIVPPSICPVGVWMRFEDVIPSTIDISRLMNAGFVFVEEAEYTAIDNHYQITKSRDVDLYRRALGVSDG